MFQPLGIALCLLLSSAVDTKAESNHFLDLVPVLAPQREQPKTEFSGKARVWVFLSAKCPCSNSHIDKLRAAFKAYSPHQIEFYGIHSNQDEDAEMARTYFENANLGFPVFRDPDAKFADRLGALKTPHVFIEGPQQKILYEGGIDDAKDAHTTDLNFLNDALADIQSGKQVGRPKTRSLGCIISRSKSL
jgi:hypothetical protein